MDTETAARPAWGPAVLATVGLAPVAALALALCWHGTVTGQTGWLLLGGCVALTGLAGAALLSPACWGLRGGLPVGVVGVVGLGLALATVLLVLLVVVPSPEFRAFTLTYTHWRQAGCLGC